MLPIVEVIESKADIKYVLAEYYKSSSPTVFKSAKDIPSFGIVKKGDINFIDDYLVFYKTEKVNMEKVKRNDGTIVYPVHQGNNEKSICLRFGGIYKKEAMIAGRVATISKDPNSLSLLKLFSAEIRKRFKKVKSFYIGNEAEKLLDKGYRLTTSVQSPKEYDLAR
jgi:hypothetical protein